MHYVEIGAPSRIKPILKKKFKKWQILKKSYSAVLSRAHLWCVILAGGLWFVSLCALLGVVIAQFGECDEAVVVCGWAT